MRPRGLSSSSPSTWYVGQVAVQKPQCTHLRRMASASAPSAVPANSGERWVCTGSEIGVEPAAVEDAVRVELALELAMDAIQRRSKRMEARRACAARRSPEQRGVAARLPGHAAHVLGVHGIGGDPALAALPLD